MILLSFDIEEFDVPREHGVDIAMTDQVAASVQGTHRILDILKEEDVKATFFCTANFAQQATDVIQRIQAEGHEVASHGFYHWTFQEEDLLASRLALENITKCPVVGYRQARMMPVSEDAIREAGYTYNSSLNPTFIPGRYMHLTAPRTYFKKADVWQVPASVSPLIRFPLFWLSMHNLPMSVYLWLCDRALQKDRYLTTYFHPWEFIELQQHPEWKLPYIIRNQSGKSMCQRLQRFIQHYKQKNQPFITYQIFIRQL